MLIPAKPWGGNMRFIAFTKSYRIKFNQSIRIQLIVNIFSCRYAGKVKRKFTKTDLEIRNPQDMRSSKQFK